LNIVSPSMQLLTSSARDSPGLEWLLPLLDLLYTLEAGRRLVRPPCLKNSTPIHC
jgi:hypothetical protein